jgi:hypothetical protein
LGYFRVIPASPPLSLPLSCYSGRDDVDDVDDDGDDDDDDGDDDDDDDNAGPF